MFSGKTLPENKLCVSDRVPSRVFCFPGKQALKNKLCVSDEVPSRGFCFPGKHSPKVSYATLMKFQQGLLSCCPFGVHLGRSFGVHVGSMCAVGQQSELVIPSGKQFDPPWTDLGAFLDPMLAPRWPHVGPMMAPCWRPLDVLGHLGAFLERSGAYLEAILD